MGGKKQRRDREEDRDVSERVALGQAAKPTGGEALFDARLFNQSSGLDAGFEGDDKYDLSRGARPLCRGPSRWALLRPSGTEHLDQFCFFFSHAWPPWLLNP